MCKTELGNTSFLGDLGEIQGDCCDFSVPSWCSPLSFRTQEQASRAYDASVYDALATPWCIQEKNVFQILVFSRLALFGHDLFLQCRAVSATLQLSVSSVGKLGV